MRIDQLRLRRKSIGVLAALVIFPISAALIGSAGSNGSNNGYYCRGLRMDQTADPAAYLAICRALDQHPHCAGIRPCLEIIEDEFLPYGVRRQVVNTIALVNEPDIREGFRKVPKELGKLKEEFDKDKKNFRKHLLKDVEKYLAPNEELAEALRDSINRMTDDELGQLLDAALALSEEELLDLLDEIREAILQAVG